jgi:threonine/homoserine/homoserine lactone efflux protein
MFIHLLIGATLGVSAGAAPGALQAYLLHQTTQHGWRRALPAVLAPLLSDIPIILLVLFILTRFPREWLRVLQVVGGSFLLFLAWEAYQAFRKHDSLVPNQPPAAPQTFLKAVMANALNAGPYIFWSVIAGPLLLKTWAESHLAAVGFVIVFHLALISMYAVQVFFFATVSRIGTNTARRLSAIASLALLLMGLYQIWTGLTGW